MIGVALVGALMILASSVKTSINDSIDKNFVGDFVLATGGFGGTGFSPDLAAQVKQVPEVDVVAPIRLGVVQIGGAGNFLTAIDPVATAKLVDLGVKSGSLRRARPGHGRHHRHPGRPAGLEGGRHHRRQVRQDRRPTAEGGRHLLATSCSPAPTLDLARRATNKNFDEQLDYSIYTKLKPGASLPPMRRRRSRSWWSTTRPCRSKTSASSRSPRPIPSTRSSR